MTNTQKRYLVSTLETFLATFFVTFLGMLESSASLSKEILLSALFAGLVAGSRSIIKALREYLTKKL
jgi:hypothetical protein